MGQTDIEERLLRIAAQIRKGEITPSQAFTSEADWLLETEGQRYLLHPVLLRWLVLDHVHDECYDTGYGPGEALMVVQGKRAGAVPLPERSADALATVGDWCLVADGDQRIGVWRDAAVRAAFARGEFTPRAQVWSGALSAWCAAEAYVRLPTPAGVTRLPLLPSIRPAEAPAKAASPTSVRFCTGCGAELQHGARFCSGCGLKVVAN